jgi:trehalose/maltose hydrolase-like predicted phosphorylase
MFRLIRIKDKLKSENNNVHINYMFHGKVQCELQVCFVMSDKDRKLQKNNMMNHYFYELKRGMFGVVPELAIIINQNDPVYTLHSQAYQVFKKYSSSSRVKFYEERTAPL